MSAVEARIEIEAGGLTIAAAPHLRDAETVEKIMYSVLLALVPATVSAVILFGLAALRLVAVCCAAAVAAEWVFQRLRGQEPTITDGSALITGLLLALNLPPRFPTWMAVVGAFVAIVIGKQLFGGLGYNPFNPALVGRAFLVAAFPVHMTRWYSPFDGMATATPLALMKMSGESTSYLRLFLGNVGGCIGETSALALLLGGAFLLYKGYIDWRIPLGYLGTVGVMAAVFGADPLFHLLAGGLLLGALFMATDMVTTPVTKNGRWIFGIGAGLIVVIIRLWGGYPEGVSFSILLMNAVTPLLNRLTKPRPFGEVKARA